MNLPHIKVQFCPLTPDLVSLNDSDRLFSSSGPARTDFTSYHLVNQRRMLKWQDQHCDSLDTGLLNIGQLKGSITLFTCLNQTNNAE